MKATKARTLALRSAARIAMSSATLAFMFVSQAALAQNTPPGSSETTDDGTIIVTAQRREQALMSVPQAVQGLSGESLLRNGVTDIAQAISLVPSATTGATIGAGSTTYQIRAIAASETDGDPAVGYYLDNFAFTMPGRPYAPVATFYDLQRVEVLRGPSGTLYGLGSIGGTIKVLTKDPELDRTGGSVRASGNLVTGGKPGFSGDVMLNLPIINDKLALRGVLSYKRVGGYADIIPTGVRNDNPATTFTGRLKLLAKPTEDLTIRLSAWRNNTKQRWSDRITFADPASIDQQFGEALSDYWLFSGDIEYDLGFATLQSSTGHIKNSVISNNGGFIPGIGNFVSLWPLTTHNFNEDIRLTSNGSGPLQYIFGFFYQNGDTFGGQTVQLPDFVVAPGVNGFNTVNDRNQLFSTGWAVYGQATYSVFDRKLDLTVGGRYYQERRRFVENSQLEIAGSVIPNQSTTRSSSSTFNPRFNVAYHAGQSGLLYVEAAKGFRSGAISSASIVGASNAVLGVNLSNISPPDTLWNYEAGMKWSLFDNTVQFELAGYYVDWPRAQIELSPALQTIVAQVGDVRGYGIEPSITWRTPLRGLTLNFNGNFNSTTIHNVAAPIVARIPQLRDGNQLPGTAKTTFNLGGSYQTPIGSNGLELRLNARYSYRSRQQSIFNGVYAPFNGIGYARASIGTDRWEAGIFTDNIGNTVGPLNRPGGQNQIVYPRTIGISLEGRF
ncbi:TonB-dependent receptor [Novosphingobium sp. Chol11]|uniref:TonB-dependent receptor n=1 Tax=Novosphingobium sp. Chol11 TaxID=1385763 RepID=UPI0025D8145A|nr:TonB-dependent receptor [Novosphingobium sp. Chol11]